MKFNWKSSQLLVILVVAFVMSIILLKYKKMREEFKLEGWEESRLQQVEEAIRIFKSFEKLINPNNKTVTSIAEVIDIDKYGDMTKDQINNLGKTEDPISIAVYDFIKFINRQTNNDDLFKIIINLRNKNEIINKLKLDKVIEVVRNELKTELDILNKVRSQLTEKILTSGNNIMKPYTFESKMNPMMNINTNANGNIPGMNLNPK